MPKLTYAQADQVLIEAYETNFGIFNHLQPNMQMPWATSALHAPADFYEFSPYSLICDRFNDNQIGEIYKIDIQQFGSMPRFRQNILIDRAKEFLRKKAEAAKEAKKELEKQQFDKLVLGKK